MIRGKGCVKPELGQSYSRKAIHKMIGGQLQHYLPFKDGQILCGCFNTSPKLNPGAPEEVLFGRAPIVEEMAEMAYRQHTAFPIFMFRGSAHWEYIGDYFCVGLSRDVDLLKSKMKKHPQRGVIAGILYFRKV